MGYFKISSDMQHVFQGDSAVVDTSKFTSILPDVWAETCEGGESGGASKGNCAKINEFG